MCVEECDYTDDIFPTRGPFLGNTYHSLTTGGHSLCSPVNMLPEYIEQLNDEQPALDFEVPWPDIDVEPAFMPSVSGPRRKMLTIDLQHDS